MPRKTKRLRPREIIAPPASNEPRGHPMDPPRWACGIQPRSGGEHPMSLREVVNDPQKKPAVVKDCVTLVDEEVAAKSGLSGLAVKAGYAAVKGIKPGFITEVVEKLLGEFATQLDPIWAEGVAKGNATGHFISNKSRVADALLTITDAKAKNAKSSTVRGAYDKLRGSAKKNVEEAVPRLAKLLEKHVK
jgi:hypothetical protein